MRAVIQRVKKASVSVDGNVVGACGEGYLVLLCVMDNDTKEDIPMLSAKIAKLRIFEDENGKINKSITDVSGELLVISQFTLAANCRHGNRPDFLFAAKPDKAKEYFDIFVSDIKQYVPHTETGVFGEHMVVDLVNDGPFTVIIDTDDLKKKKSEL
jgi:D-tyrosyl-tRNA(Tyr) deacylase